MSDLELIGQVALPRQEADARCPRVVEFPNCHGQQLTGVCGMPLSDVAGIAGGPVCIACGVQFERGSDSIQ